MQRVCSVTSVGSVRQPCRHPVIVNPLTGWLGEQSGLFAGDRSAGRRDIYSFMSRHLKIYQRILCKKKGGPVVLNPFDRCFLAWQVDFSVEDVQS